MREWHVGEPRQPSQRLHGMAKLHHRHGARQLRQSQPGGQVLDDDRTLSPISERKATA